jgi:hypothetical protein
MRFMETADGQSIDGDRASKMREFARSIWVLLAQLHTAPSSWGQAHLGIRQFYFREMRGRFPEFRLCDLNWKANFVAAGYYSKWLTKWEKRQFQLDAAQDSEDRDSEEPVPSDSDPMEGKRFRTDSMNLKVVAKRSKHDMLVSCCRL